MDKGQGHFLAGYKHFLERGDECMAEGKWYPAVSNYSLARKVLDEMAEKGIDVNGKDIKNVDKLVSKARKKMEEQRRKDAGEKSPSILSRLLQAIPRPGAKQPAPPPEKKLSLFVFGLDRAGKTTLLDYLKQGKYLEHSPTLGIEVTSIVLGRIKFQFSDLGGQVAFRSTWMNHWADPDLLVFMIDAADASRFPEAKAALWSILDKPEAKGKPLLVISNKVDLPDARSIETVKNALGLASITGRDVGVTEVSVKENKNMDKVLAFLASIVLQDEEMKDYVDEEVARLARNFEEIYKAFIEEAKELEKRGDKEKARDRVYKAKLVQEELLEEGFMKAASKIQKCKEWLAKLA
ncbi:MAG: ADP-ribosylation factor-like protein [Candidatus Sigynarchaeota archaeon]